MKYQTQLLAAMVALLSAVQAGTWTCDPLEGGPGADGLQGVKEAYERVFMIGHDDQTVDELTSKTVHCNGLVYGPVNGGGVNEDDTAAARDQSVADGAQIGNGQMCVWHDDSNIGYIYGSEDDFECGALGGTATAGCDERYC